MEDENDVASIPEDADTFSDSEDSAQDDYEIATISDVFADMLVANEDLLQVTAEYQVENDVQAVLAYQKILHRNLIEMADFVDAMFGVYNKSGDKNANTKDHPDDIAQQYQAALDDSAGTFEDVNGNSSEEATDSAGAQEAPRLRSLLIDRFRLENRRRLEQRSARMWQKMRNKVRVEESVGAVMSEAAERMGRAGTKDDVPSDPPEAVETNVAGENATSTEETESSVVSLAEAQMDSPSTPEATVTPQPLNPPVLIQAAPGLILPTLAPPPPIHPFLALSAPFQPAPITSSTSGVVLAPQGATAFSKVQLPSASSSLAMMYPIPPPTLYPPNQLSTVCVDCIPLRRTAHECRIILKHVSPPPPTMLFQGQAMWPMAVNIEAIQPARSVPQLRQASISAFKKACDDCKKHHKSVHYCRKTLGHTAPEWQPIRDADQPRKRRGRQPRVQTTTEDSSAPVHI